MLFLTKPSGCMVGKFTVVLYCCYYYYYYYDGLYIRDSIPGKNNVFFSSSPLCHRHWVQPASNPVCTGDKTVRM